MESSMGHDGSFESCAKFRQRNGQVEVSLDGSETVWCGIGNPSVLLRKDKDGGQNWMSLDGGCIWSRNVGDRPCVSCDYRVSLPVTGYRNPAIAALALARESTVPYDEESFRSVAAIVGDASPDVLQGSGFNMCATPLMEGFERMCRIGGFSVYFDGGKLRCRMEIGGR